MLGRIIFFFHFVSHVHFIFQVYCTCMKLLLIACLLLYDRSIFFASHICQSPKFECKYMFCVCVCAFFSHFEKWEFISVAFKKCTYIDTRRSMFIKLFIILHSHYDLSINVLKVYIYIFRSPLWKLNILALRKSYLKTLPKEFIADFAFPLSAQTLAHIHYIGIFIFNVLWVWYVCMIT